MTRIESCLRASLHFMNPFHLRIVDLCLIGILMAFAPIAAGQMTEKVLYRFGGNSSGAISNVIRDSAGNFYGTTQLGGTGNAAPGTVFKVDPTGKQTILYSFKGIPSQSDDGAQPMAGLVMDAAGNLYGTTPYGGGPKGNGTVFKVDPAGNYTNVVSYSTFLGPSGGVPEGGLLLDSAGNLYGTTYSGGNFNFGVVFKVSTSGTNYTALYNFAGPGGDGANPRATLVIDAAGNLYGTTLNGGTGGKGIVFKLDPTGKETVLHSFTGTNGDGASPEGALAIDQAGNLYGTTLNGGAAGKGIVFKLDSAGNETVLHSFTGTNGDGANPDGGLIRDSAGNLYGTTLHGGATGNGAVFKVNSTGLETVVYSFTGTNGDGSQPQASLTLDAAGNLYGTTWLGGTSGGGTIFKLDPAANETVLFSFAGPNGDGLSPQSELIMDSAGNLYGTTPNGGATIGNCNQCGTIFKVDPRTGNETVVYRFTKTNGDGAFPQSGLIQDSAGNFYGTTDEGGAGGSPTFFNLGSVFKLDSAGNETTLYSFTQTNGDGANPRGGLVRDSAGNLYGTTQTGGSSNGFYGTVFKLDPTGLETVLHSFTGGSGDAYPEAGLILDSAGNLYGTASDDSGGSGTGTVFKVTSAGTETVLHAFTGPGDGADPKDALIMDAKGNLYGTTYGGGVSTGLSGNCPFGCGVVFKVDAQGNETVLYAFTGANGDGSKPQGPVIMDSAGNLYGTTTGGGAFSSGTVFKLDPAGHETVLYSFIGTKVGTTGDGSAPLGGLIMDSAGKLYGTTSSGGQSTARCAFGCGTIFVLEPGGVTTTTLTSSPNPSAYGQSVTFTATVTAQSTGTPTGTVAFSSNGFTLGTATLNTSGQATFTTNSAAQGNPLPKGSDSIVAQYGGDSTFASSTSTPLSQQVGALTATTTALTSSVNPSVSGQPVTFTATVTPQGSGTPTGTVTFSEGGTTLGTGSLNASAQATFTTTSLAQGTHSIVAQYGGDNTFSGSTSSPLSQQVLAPLQSITVSPNPASVAVGHTLQFMATGHYSDGSTRDLTTAVTWSSNHKTATISNSPGSQGLATGVEVEKGVIITASQGTISGTALLNVTPH